MAQGVSAAFSAMAPKKGDKAKAEKAEKTAKAVKANVGKKVGGVEIRVPIGL